MTLEKIQISIFFFTKTNVWDLPQKNCNWCGKGQLFKQYLSNVDYGLYGWEVNDYDIAAICRSRNYLKTSTQKIKILRWQSTSKAAPRTHCCSRPKGATPTTRCCRTHFHVVLCQRSKFLCCPLPEIHISLLPFASDPHFFVALCQRSTFPCCPFPEREWGFFNHIVIALEKFACKPRLAS